MNSIHQQQAFSLTLPVPDFSTITTRLMESAAAVESHVQDLTHRLEDREREIQWLKDRLQQRDEEVMRTRRFNAGGHVRTWRNGCRTRDAVRRTESRGRSRTRADAQPWQS